MGLAKGKGIKQQWHDSCAPTTMQAMMGELDPIYALKLHEEWARESFDADGNGLYSSYTNTWPTDSQWCEAHARARAPAAQALARAPAYFNTRVRSRALTLPTPTPLSIVLSRT